MPWGDVIPGWDGWLGCASPIGRVKLLKGAEEVGDVFNWLDEVDDGILGVDILSGEEFARLETGSDIFDDEVPLEF